MMDVEREMVCCYDKKRRRDFYTGGLTETRHGCVQSPDSNNLFNYSALTGGQLLSHTQGLLVSDNCGH